MELHRTRSLLHDAPDIDRRIILKDCRFTGSSPDNSGTCVQIDYTLEAPTVIREALENHKPVAKHLKGS